MLDLATTAVSTFPHTHTSTRLYIQHNARLGYHGCLYIPTHTPTRLYIQHNARLESVTVTVTDTVAVTVSQWLQQCQVTVTLSQSLSVWHSHSDSVTLSDTVTVSLSVTLSLWQCYTQCHRVTLWQSVTMTMSHYHKTVEARITKFSPLLH